jgi:predicted nucleotidyltransferase
MRTRTRTRTRIPKPKAGPAVVPVVGPASPAATSPFARLFASETLVSVLKLFLMNAERAYYQAQVARITGARLYVVQRELARLERAGLVLREASGNRIYYRANRQHPALEDLKRAFLKTVLLGDSLRAALAPLAGKVRAAFIYGSYARGEEREHSDVDLFIVGDLTVSEEVEVLGEAGRAIGRELNTAIFPPEEFQDKAQSGHYFIEDVLRNPKIFIIGDENELAAAAGGGASPSPAGAGPGDRETADVGGSGAS